MIDAFIKPEYCQKDFKICPRDQAISCSQYEGCLDRAHQYINATLRAALRNAKQELENSCTEKRSNFEGEYMGYHLEVECVDSKDGPEFIGG